ncbi:hypothetical protein [Mesorhizobium ventifaucium]|uniref:hypothetical protein n=1 Tax=Mesorhizobium ventifaucium TaxID=666020 RepID=UPI0020A75217|nr:hypothetical protein [Mesorhizobium ventifaucium]
MTDAINKSENIDEETQIISFDIDFIVFFAGPKSKAFPYPPATDGPTILKTTDTWLGDLHPRRFEHAGHPLARFRDWLDGERRWRGRSGATGGDPLLSMKDQPAFHNRPSHPAERCVSA